MEIGNQKFPIGLDVRQWTDRETIRSHIFDLSMESFSLRWMIDASSIAPPPSWKIQGDVSKWWATCGNTHLAVQIGRLLLHWTRNSIVMTTEFLSSKPILIIGHTAESDMIPNTREKQDAIIDIIIEWNKFQTWGPNTTSYHFIRAIYDKIHQDMECYHECAVERFVKFAMDMEHLTPVLIRADGKMYPTKDQPAWETHEAIDQWSITILPNMRPQLNANERSLLKGFHRAFQLRGHMGLGWNKKDANGKEICLIPSVTVTHKRRYNPNRDDKAERIFNECSHVRSHDNVPKSVESRILVLEHCGVRGVHQLFAIHEIEVRMQQFSWEIYDVIVGVGSGAVVAMALSSFHMSARYLLEYFYFKQNQAANQITNKQEYVYTSLEQYWDYELNSHLNALYQTPRLIVVGIDNETIYTNASTCSVRQVIEGCAQGWPCFPGQEAMCPRRSALEVARRIAHNCVMYVCETEWIDDKDSESLSIYGDLVSFTNIAPFPLENDQDNVVYCRSQSNRKRITYEASYLDRKPSKVVNAHLIIDRLNGIQKKKLKTEIEK